MVFCKSTKSRDKSDWSTKYQNIWMPFAAAILSQNNTDLNTIVVTDNNGKLWNRIFLQTQINSTTNKSLILNLDYGSRSWEHSLQKLEVRTVAIYSRAVF
jgi:hypothetical protein